MNAVSKYYEKIGDTLTGEEQERAYRHAQNALDVTSDLDDWKRIQSKLIKNLKIRAAAASHASRWGLPRGKSRQVRVSEEAFAVLQRLPERDRRDVASQAIIAAVSKYKA